MKILFDIGHPAHVHYFKNTIKTLKSRGNEIFIVARDKEMTHKLLKEYDLKFISRQKGKNSFFGKIFYLIKTDIWLFFKALKQKPDLFIGFGSPYAAHVAFLTKKPAIILDDTDNAKFGQLFYKKFATEILSPSTFAPDFGKKHIKFESYMELSYLHPNYFNPDYNILEKIGIKDGEKYTVVRFVSWNAQHDYGHKGISTENKIKVINEFRKFGKVFITSEMELPTEIENFRLKINPTQIHHLLAGASLFYGESATMASESAMLGTPSIYLDNEGRGYTKEQEKKYGIVFNFSESEEDQGLSIKKGIDLLQQDKEKFSKIRKQILNDKIDLTSLLIWFLENYPLSASVLKENPDYQFRFK